MSRNLRRRYYDLFSRFYDAFVALHSGDRGGSVRGQLASRAQLKKGDAVLDICTGTGSLLLNLREQVGTEGIAVGVDFSRGMLKAAQTRARVHRNIHLVQADAAQLPFKAETLDVVTCSHAFYELKGSTPHRCLREVSRVLKNHGRFFMMEHDVPENPFVRFLFYVRLLSMGSRKALSILKNEENLFRRYFDSVDKFTTETGRSKVFACEKGESGGRVSHS